LKYKQGKFLTTPKINGNVMNISLECYIESMNKLKGIRIKAAPVHKLPYNITLTTETNLSRFKGYLGESDIRTTDKQFDNEILLDGWQEGVIAMLSRWARTLILRLKDNIISFYLSQNIVDITIYKRNESALSLIYRIKLICSLIHELSRDNNLKTLLEGNIRNDPEISVRKRNLEILIQEYHHNIVKIEDVLNSCLEDRAWEVSITAAPY